jgi:hypothetical protein
LAASGDVFDGSPAGCLFVSGRFRICRDRRRSPRPFRVGRAGFRSVGPALRTRAMAATAPERRAETGMGRARGRPWTGPCIMGSQPLSAWARSPFPRLGTRPPGAPRPEDTAEEATIPIGSGPDRRVHGPIDRSRRVARFIRIIHFHRFFPLQMPISNPKQRLTEAKQRR